MTVSFLLNEVAPVVGDRSDFRNLENERLQGPDEFNGVDLFEFYHEEKFFCECLMGLEAARLAC